MIADTITAADASATSGVTTLMYSPSTAAMRTAILRTESANTCVYAEHYFIFRMWALYTSMKISFSDFAEINIGCACGYICNKVHTGDE